MEAKKKIFIYDIRGKEYMILRNRHKLRIEEKGAGIEINNHQQSMKTANLVQFMIEATCFQLGQTEKSLCVWRSRKMRSQIW